MEYYRMIYIVINYNVQFLRETNNPNCRVTSFFALTITKKIFDIKNSIKKQFLGVILIFFNHLIISDMFYEQEIKTNR